MIKINMDMPKNCGLCPLQHDEMEYCKIDIWEREVYKYHSERPEWCPLIEDKDYETQGND